MFASGIGEQSLTFTWLDGGFSFHPSGADTSLFQAEAGIRQALGGPRV